ncbi:MAG TPA: XamI family restriction endonuclease [Acidobacteria bacterium]|nr:XamI family restriction endonuclease [Acidobacteriota bacterium]
MILSPVWSDRELDKERLTAIEAFRAERLDEPLEQYLEAFDGYQGVMDELMETTVDLTRLEETALEVLADRRLRDAFRYLAGPIISADDLKTLAEASLSAKRLREDPEMVARIVEIIRAALDRRRFSWVSEDREASQGERQAAVLASAALMANAHTATLRRQTGKSNQEEAVRQKLVAGGLREVARRPVPTLTQAPEPGEFCLESLLGKRKADLVVRLWDGRIMPIECKVSNSAVNSVKRLNNDAAAKAESWLFDFGRRQTVPVAVLGGVFDLHNLRDAQDRGLCLFWGHDLGALTDWIERTRKGW